MTYPRDDVQQTMALFELVRVSLASREPDGRTLIKRYRTLWSPGFVLLDHNQTELRRFLGFQHGADLVAELRVGLGKVHLLHRRPEEAFAEWRAVADLDPPAPVSAEALYWSGIARFQQEKRSVDWLGEYWAELGERFPNSRWWTHANVWQLAAGN